MVHGADDFVRMAIEEFHELHEWLQENEGLLHVQVGALADITQRAKGRGDWDVYARAIALADTLYRSASPDLENALNVSFLEHLDFAGPRGSKAWQVMTPGLRNGWIAMQRYLDDLFGGSEGTAPPSKGKGNR